MAYGTWWCKTNMGQNIKEDVLRSALRKQLDVLEEADEENIAFGNVKICLEEMEHDEEIKTCIPFDEGSLQDFRENQAEDTEGEEDGQAEFEAFAEFAEANLMTSKEVLAFAEKRGARVEVVNSAAKITGHNGVQVLLLPGTGSVVVGQHATLRPRNWIVHSRSYLATHGPQKLDPHMD